MTEIYLYFMCTHYGLYGNAPVVELAPAAEAGRGRGELAGELLVRDNDGDLLTPSIAAAAAVDVRC